MVNRQSATNQGSASRLRPAFVLWALVGLVGCQELGPVSGRPGPREAPGVTTLALPDDAPSPWASFDTEARAIYAGVELGSRGVLVCGGSNDAQYATTCNQLSLDTDGKLRSQSFPLPKGRIAGTLTLLPSNRVLLAGGLDSTNQPTKARLSLPVPSWANGGDIWGVDEGPLRVSHTATLLDSSVVLIGGDVGGDQVTSIDVRSEQGDWTKVDVSSELTRRGGHTATVLKSQPGGAARVLILGGYNQVQRRYLSSGFIFSLPNIITPIADMPDARQSHTATLLDDGSVLVVGGEGGPGAQGFLAEALRYYPDRDSWVRAGSTVPRKFHATARLGADVIVAGGESEGGATGGGAILGGSADGQPNQDTVQRYDPVANVWSRVPNLLHGREQFQLFALDQTHLLAVGGVSYNYHVLASSELFTAGALGQASSDPKSCLSGHVADGVCCETECGEPCHWCNDPTKPGTCKLVDGATPNENGCDNHLQCTAGTCAKRCGASPCEVGYYCDADGACQKTNAVGKGCNANSECADGKPCVDGVCCDSPCSGSCESCNQEGQPGHCWPLPAGVAPLDGHPACPVAQEQDSACAARCDGQTRAHCVFAASRSRCGDATCTGTSFQQAPECNGLGICVQRADATDCSPYLCGQSGCLDGCVQDNECSQGKCKDGKCVGCAEVEEECNRSGYRCDPEVGECRHSCEQSETDCAGLYYCHPLQHRCVKGIAFPAGQLPACGMGRAPVRSRHSMLALALLCAVAAWRKRRASYGRTSR
jgi:hypothetical protein